MMLLFVSYTVNCPVGYFYNTTGKSCDPCPADHYQMNEAQETCEACPKGTTTSGLRGTRWKSECVGRWLSLNQWSLVLRAEGVGLVFPPTPPPPRYFQFRTQTFEAVKIKLSVPVAQFTALKMKIGLETSTKMVSYRRKCYKC